MKTIFALLAALPFTVACFAVHAEATPAAGPASRNFAATVPAAALTQVRLDVMVGQVQVQAGATDAVKIRVHAEPGNHSHFIFNWTYGPSANTLPAGLHLVSRREGGTLYLCLASKRANGCDFNTKSPSAKTKNGGSGNTNVVAVNPLSGRVVFNSDHHAGWKSHWTITLPARLALKLNLKVGKADIAGVGGGVNAEIDVGKLDAQLPRGPLTANVDVGSIEAEVGSADYGPVNLSANIGHVEFYVKGNQIGAGYEHHTTGANQHTTGPGTTAYKIETNIGSVKLKLGVRGIPSLPPLTASAPQAASAPTPASQTKPAVPASPRQTTPASVTTARAR